MSRRGNGETPVEGAALALLLMLGAACAPAPAPSLERPAPPQPPPTSSVASSPPPAAASSAALPEPVASAAPSPPPEASAGTGCPAGMLRIEGGSFLMGSDSGDENEKPVHSVEVAAYCLDAREVAVADYRRCVDAGKCLAHTTADWPGITEKDRQFRSLSCNWGRSDRDAHPINCVDWRQSSAYCAWANKRLPTEEEWEFAARGKDGRIYPWGNEPPGPTRLNACGDECVAWAKGQGVIFNSMYGGDDGYPTTAPVGSFAAGRSPFGVYDLAGNVAEWTASGYSQNYSRARNNVARVLRGGGVTSETADLVRATLRHKHTVTDRMGGIGFRCAQ